MTTHGNPERRGFEAPGWIGGYGGALSPCVILDVSQNGARLAVKEPFKLPQNLQLYLSPTAQSFRRCVVRWRKNDSVGVQFQK
jgi:hypothetical protein